MLLSRQLCHDSWPVSSISYYNPRHKRSSDYQVVKICVSMAFEYIRKDAMSDQQISILFTMTQAQGEALVKLLRYASFTGVKKIAMNDVEAGLMGESIVRMVKALTDAGFGPP
jgi:hypothetical protein